MVVADDSGMIIAAGAVVWRESTDGPEIVVVHRPKYDDWSLPKGKLDPGEIAPVAAVREVEEETGLRVRLGARLPVVRYLSSRGPKAVWFWVATAYDASPREPDAEVDEVAWVPLGELDDRLSYEDDRMTVAAAVPLLRAKPLVIVRHATAVPRQDWPTENDRTRPLVPQGHAEALRLKSILDPWDVQRVVTSPALRCLDTLAPYAGARAMELGLAEELTEEVGEHDPARMLAYINGLIADGVSTLVCTHRPLLASIADTLGAKLPDADRREPLPPAGVWVLHLWQDGEASPTLFDMESYSA